MKDDDNIGEIGVESIRIHGKKIENLPLGQNEIARMQLPEAIANQKEQRIKSIRARYPAVSIPFLEGAISEAESNIVTFNRTISDHRVRIADYQGLVRMAEGRRSYHSIEPEIDDIAAREDLTHEEKVAEIKALKKDATPFEMIALQRQVKQFEVDIRNFEKAIIKENDTIMELRENLALCRQRDRELLQAGAEVG